MHLPGSSECTDGISKGVTENPMVPIVNIPNETAHNQNNSLPTKSSRNAPDWAISVVHIPEGSRANKSLMEQTYEASATSAWMG